MSALTSACRQISADDNWLRDSLALLTLSAAVIKREWSVSQMYLESKTYESILQLQRAT
jgi:hypothetical protein